MEIFLFEDLFRRFFLLWRCVHGDLSFEDLFRRFFLLEIYLGDFSFDDLFRRFLLLKIYEWDFSYEDLFKRFSFRRFVRRFFPFEDLFMEIFSFVRMCSWRFVHWKLKCRTFNPFLRFVHENLKIWIGDFSLEYMFMEICPLKIWIGDLSLANLFVEICPLKICSEDFSFWNFVLEIYPFKNLRNLSFEFFCRRFVLLKIWF